MIKYFIYAVVAILGINAQPLFSQEMVLPLLYNYNLQKNDLDNSLPSIKRTTPIELPFLETFHYYQTSQWPSDEWWVDSQVYINNQFTNNHRNIGVATFDVLNQNGAPYNSEWAWGQQYCDSLTTYKIDLSPYSVGDSVYLSFDYLGGGLGFFPKPSDSLLIYFRDSINGWQKVAHILPDGSSEWKTFILPVLSSSFFYSEFQFRIINKGIVGYSGSHWHIDNVYLNSGRHYQDTIIKNFAFNIEGTSFLKDFTAMPWRHYATNRELFTSDSLHVYTYLHDELIVSAVSPVEYTATFNGTLVGSGVKSMEHYSGLNNDVAFANINPSLLTPSSSAPEQTLVFRYHLDNLIDELQEDNYIETQTHFAHYMAYDDGHAEQAYFLNLSPGVRGEVAVEYACYVPDTLAGVQIQFIPQVPFGTDKEFYIKIYKSITEGSADGELIYEQSGNYPIYTRDNNGIVTYPLEELVPLSEGVFYVSIMMPASGISDSLMIGLDVNRRGGNHRYYNVLDMWESSLIEGALIVRPVFSGRKLSQDNVLPSLKFNVYPNPSQDIIYLQMAHSNYNKITYSITDMNGRSVLKGDYTQTGIPIQSLTSGIYQIFIVDEQGQYGTLTFIKK